MKSISEYYSGPVFEKISAMESELEDARQLAKVITLMDFSDDAEAVAVHTVARKIKDAISNVEEMRRDLWDLTHPLAKSKRIGGKAA